MINWLCGAPPARPPHPSSVKAAVTHQHASVVSITGICRPQQHRSTCSTEYTSAAHGHAPHSYGLACGSALSEYGTDPAAATAPLRGIGVLIHPTLILTTHSTIPSPLSIRDAEITFCRDVASLTYVKRKFVPEIFFETNADLDLTIVSCEIVAPELSYSLPLDTTKLRRRSLRKDHPIFIMGCQVRKPDEIVIMEGCIAGIVRSKTLQDNVFLRFQTAGDEIWMPGTAGFDEFGNFSFIVTQPSAAKLQEDMQSSSCQLNDEQPIIGSRISASDRSQASPQKARFFAHKPKQSATCVQAIKEWVEPLWKEKRNEVFEGTMQSLPVAKQTRRPSTQGDALFRQKSFTPRTSMCSGPQTSHNLLACKQEINAEESAFTAKQPAILSDKMEADESLVTSIRSIESPGVLALMPALEKDCELFDQELNMGSQQTSRSPRKLNTYKQRLTKNIIFSALSKHNGMKKISGTTVKPKKPIMESVCVQTTTPPDADAQNESQEEAEDSKPGLRVRRTSEPLEANPRSRGKNANAGIRERWSLPGELDPIIMKPNTKLPTIPRGANAVTSNTKKSMHSSKPGASSWIDSYYSLGRSRSDHGVKALHPGSFATPPFNRTQNETSLNYEDWGLGAHNDDGHDSYIPNESSPNVQRSLSSPSSSLYNKPTLSYMQRRSLAQREQLARRASQPSNSPRWS